MTTPYYWTKRIGPKHISGNGVSPDHEHGTLCGKPMLGNNYAYVEGSSQQNAEPCHECAQAFDALTDPKRTT